MHVSTTKLVVLSGLCVLQSVLVGKAFGQETNDITIKTKVASAADLPKFEYQLPTRASDLVADETVFDPFAARLRSYVIGVLRDYEIEDKATLEKLDSTLLELDLLDGNNEDAMQHLTRVKQLNVKSDSAGYSLDGVLNEAIICARIQSGTSVGDEYQLALQTAILDLLDQQDWATWGKRISIDVKLLDLFSESFALGTIGNTLEAEAGKNGNTISFTNASRAVSFRLLLTLIIPSKTVIKQAFDDSISTHKTANGELAGNPGIWIKRNIELTNEQKLTPVVVAVWDSGVDIGLYESQLWTNSTEQMDGLDNDNNGFIDDLHGIGLENDIGKTAKLLCPIGESDLGLVASEVLIIKGMADLQNGKDTPGARAARQRFESIASLQPEQRTAMNRAQNIFSGYVHGSHVAGIAIKGNPAARLLTIARIFDLNREGRMPTTIEWSREFAARSSEVSAYLKSTDVRVVNMSFGDDLEFFDQLLQENGIGDDEAERRKIATESFQIYRTAFEELISSCPEVLFVCSAGNSDDDANFTKRVPQSIDLPNLIAVGAVDGQGQTTGFTCIGKHVAFYANGSNVESFIPGGERIELSGTSQAAPAVTNLAGKLFAMEPLLSVAEVIELIRDGASIGPAKEMLLINPKNSVELLIQHSKR